MSFPEYSEYECSGFDWLGMIPRHWRTDKFRYVFTESNEKIENEVVGEMLSVSGYRGIEIKIYDDENKRRTEEELQGYRIVRPGQLVVNTMWLNYAGLGVSNYEGHVSPAYRSYWINADVDLRFIHHLMRSSIYVQGYTQLLTGIRPNSLQMSRDDLMGFPVVLAPRAEQTQIARVLDHETAKIDALIREQERLIELLQEKRQAVISHAVTKGLDPDVPMKDSGVEWLGEVPKHWQILQLGKKIQLQRGVDITKDGQEEGQIPVVSSGGISSYHNIAICKGPGVVVGRKGTAGKVQFIESDYWPHDTTLYVSEFRGNSPRYVYYKLVSMELENYDTGSANPTLNRNVIHPQHVVWPPFSDQVQIAEYLDRQTRAIKNLQHQSVTTIELLKERRSAFISAAVTGKIDVRDWRPPADESAYDEEVRQVGLEAPA